MVDYTPEQIGEISVRPISRKTVDPFSVIVIQPNSNDQIVVAEPCDWSKGHILTLDLIRRGVDPDDIRFCYRNDRTITNTDGLPLRPCIQALWWTPKDVARLSKEINDGME